MIIIIIIIIYVVVVLVVHALVSVPLLHAPMFPINSVLSVSLHQHPDIWGSRRTLEASQRISPVSE